jgi:hypothetical protein
MVRLKTERESFSTPTRQLVGAVITKSRKNPMFKDKTIFREPL